MTTSPGADAIAKGGEDRLPNPAAPGGLACVLCGEMMLERKCKIVCPRCGCTRDCSDP